MQKIKVLHIVEALGGGVYSYFIDLSNYFGQDQETETTIIYSDKRPEIIPEKIKEDFNKNVELINVSISKEISISKDFLSLISLIKQIKLIKPNIIHLHSSKISVIGRLAYLFSFSKSKLFYTPHGYAFLRQDISSLKRKMFHFIEKSVTALGGLTIACGDTEFSYAKKLGKASLIRNGVNVEEVAKLVSRKKRTKLTLGILGRITHARNPKLFNEIAVQNPNINFLWIGDGELKHLITAKNIKITGWFMNRNEGIKKLNEIDIYLQTSLWEGLPIALLEAMAMKKPVIATNIIGNKDVVKHAETGYLFNSLSEFNDCLNLLKNKSTRKILGNNGYNRAKLLFDIKNNFNVMKKLYKA